MKRVLSALVITFGTMLAHASADEAPKFKVDASWPKPLPGNWILGQVAGIAVDKNDHVWIIHRPSTLLDDEKDALTEPPATRCCKPAPAVIEFDGNGNLLRHWGGPGEGYDWPKTEHGIFVDNDGNVWIGGNDASDHQILKFTPTENSCNRSARRDRPAARIRRPNSAVRPT
jgi:hypothetical protein